MIKTTYICDVCARAQPTHEQFWGVELKTYHFGGHPPHSTKSYGLCRACMERLHLLPNVHPEVTPLPTKPTFEELVRRLIVEEIEALETPNKE